MMPHTIWYHLQNLEHVKSTHRRVLILKLTLLHGFFSSFLNCTNGTKLRNASQITETVSTFCYFLVLHQRQLLTIITKRSLLDVAAALEPPLFTSNEIEKGFLRYSAIQQRFVFLSTNCHVTKNFSI